MDNLDKKRSTGSLEATDAASQAVQKTPHRVSLASIEAKIASEQYLHPIGVPHFTICVVTLDNGFVVMGESKPVDPANYDPALGRQFAREDAIRKIWPLEGYALSDRLARGEA